MAVVSILNTNPNHNGMIKKFTLLFIGALAACSIYGQVYTQGDITVTITPGAYHDSTICASIQQLSYQITIQNSFMGDSVKVVDPNQGVLMYAEGNNSGQTPWIVNVPLFMGQLVPDMALSGGSVFFYNPDTKVISGPDTVYNVYASFPFPVPDPCEVSTNSGRIYADFNNNCTFDSGDTALLGLFVGLAPHYNSPGVIPQTMQINASGITGQYTFMLLKSWFDTVLVTMPNAYQFIFPQSGCAVQSYTFNSLPQNNVDFALQCSNNLDVQVFGGTSGTVRPLIPFYLSSGVSNLGCPHISGALKLVLDPNVTYNPGLSTNPAASVSGDTLTWNYTDLSSLATQGYWNSFFSHLHLTPNNNVGVGDSLCFEIFTAVPANDVNPANNYSSFCVRVVNSYDPNLKEVNPAGEGAPGYIPANTPELNYTVHFQNTGSAAAYNVTVRDTLDSDLDVTSLQVVGASHTMTPEWLAPNVVAFHFWNIQLPDSGTDEAGSHGLVKFKVKMKPNLTVGTEIKNSAAIYFDNNAAVITNTVLNTIAAPNSIAEVAVNNLQLYPNPSAGELNMVVDRELNAASVKIINADGQAVFEQNGLSGKMFALDLHALPAGVYLAELKNGNTLLRRRLIKM